jgi:hypothetical protein
LKAATERRILHLANRGKSAQEIAEETGTALRAVVKLLADHPEEVQPDEDDLAELVEYVRRKSGRRVKRIGEMLDTMETKLSTMVGERMNIQQAFTAYGIMLDKVPGLMRDLRGLEAESVDDLEAGWDIVVRDED